MITLLIGIGIIILFGFPALIIYSACVSASCAERKKEKLFVKHIALKNQPYDPVS